MVNLPKSLPLPGEGRDGVVGTPPPGHFATNITITKDGMRAEYVGCSGCFVEHEILGRTNAPWADVHQS